MNIFSKNFTLRVRKTEWMFVCSQDDLIEQNRSFLLLWQYAQAIELSVLSLLASDS